MKSIKAVFLAIVLPGIAMGQGTLGLPSEVTVPFVVTGGQWKTSIQVVIEAASPPPAYQCPTELLECNATVSLVVFDQSGLPLDFPFWNQNTQVKLGDVVTLETP